MYSEHEWARVRREVGGGPVEGKPLALKARQAMQEVLNAVLGRCERGRCPWLPLPVVRPMAIGAPSLVWELPAGQLAVWPEADDGSHSFAWAEKPVVIRAQLALMSSFVWALHGPAAIVADSIGEMLVVQFRAYTSRNPCSCGERAVGVT